jgi:CheY-like chemotaxis protein
MPRMSLEEPVERGPASMTSGGRETILLVEDESALRVLAAKVLSDHGDTVLTASNGAEAPQIANAPSVPELDLLLTDVIMPIMGYKEVADRLTAKRPSLRVLFTSGYGCDTISSQGILKPGSAFTQKPFLPMHLVGKVRKVLDGILPTQARQHYHFAVFNVNPDNTPRLPSTADLDPKCNFQRTNQRPIPIGRVPSILRAIDPSTPAHSLDQC